MYLWVLSFCLNTLSIRKESIAGFYDTKKNNTIWIGSSQLGGHDILKNIHAEEIAFRKIKYYLHKKGLNYSYNKHINIYIFKYKLESIKEVYCCKWCIGLIKRYKFPKQNVITIKENKPVNAINYNYEYIEPLKKNDWIL